MLEGNFGLVAFEIRRAAAVPASELRSMRDFVADYGARLGVIINNDVSPRLLNDRVIGLPFAFL
ncbi:MAG: hypothetical protein FJW35_18080 [Acidobacteria bacterium]|nr:hypothetical protein [Acidobacteriota bacterium]